MGNIKPIVFKNETPPETYKWLLKDATQLLEINKDDQVQVRGSTLQVNTLSKGKKRVTIDLPIPEITLPTKLSEFINDTEYISFSDIKSKHLLYSWGDNGEGQLGNGTPDGTFVPELANSYTNWSFVSAGSEHCVALRNGKLFAWGNNYDGQLGNGTSEVSTSPVQIGSDDDWSFVSAGIVHSLGIRDGKLFAWGNNESGQLGDASYSNSPVPIQVGNNTDWTFVSTGNTHSLGIRDGKLFAWGSNYSGQLGDGTTIDRNSPVQIGSDEDWTQVRAGNSCSFGIREGKLFAWGHGVGGTLGDGNYSNYNSPVQIGSDDDWSFVSTGDNHTLGLRNGKLFAWGGNYSGQLGDGTTIDRNSPVQIGSDEDWTYISAGRDFSLGLRGTKAFSWGTNFFGQLGDHTSADKIIPTQIGHEKSWLMISAGTSYSVGLAYEPPTNQLKTSYLENDSGFITSNDLPKNTSDLVNDSGFITCDTLEDCFVPIQGVTYAWGQNAYSAVSNSLPTAITSPTELYEYGFDAVSVNVVHSLYIKKGKLYSYGTSNNGYTGIDSSGSYLGQGASPTFNALVHIPGYSDWDSVATLQSSSFAIRKGKLYIFGSVSSGVTYNVPTQWESDSDWEYITGGTFDLLALKGGKLYHFEGGTMSQVGSDIGWSDISIAGAFFPTDTGHVLGIIDGKILSVGNNSMGQLGLGNTDYVSSFSQVGNFEDWDVVSAGYQYSLAIRDGKLYAWGDNSKGQFGDGTTQSSLVPVQIGTDTDWINVCAGKDFSIGEKAGKLYYWGINLSYGTTNSLPELLPMSSSSFVYDTSSSSASGYTVISVPDYRGIQLSKFDNDTDFMSKSQVMDLLQELGLIS